MKASFRIIIGLRWRFLAFSSVVIFFIIFMLNFLYLNLPAAPKPNPLKLIGFVFLESMFNKAPVLHPNLDLRIDGNPVTSALVRVDGMFNVPHKGGGLYEAYIEGYKADPNKIIEITVLSGLPVFPRREPLLTAQGKIMARVEFVSPAPNAVINLATTRSIAIRWRSSGGSGWRTQLWVNETPYPGGPSGAAVFRNSNVIGDSVDLASSSFRPNQNYRIILFIGQQNIFTFKGLVTSDSSISAGFEVDTYFSTR